MRSKNEILKVQRNPNKIIIAELLPVSPINSLPPAPSNGVLTKSSNSVNGDTCECAAKPKNVSQSLLGAVSTFQPIRSPAKSLCSVRSLDVATDDQGSPSKESTHYIILPDPRIDTKIIDGILKNKEVNGFEDAKF